jgi:hypothetical protein
MFHAFLFVMTCLGSERLDALHPPSPLPAGGSVIRLANSASFPPVIVSRGGTVPFAGWSDRFWHFLEGQLSNQTRMIQFCTLGMLLGLFVIWYRRS